MYKGEAALVRRTEPGLRTTIFFMVTSSPRCRQHVSSYMAKQGGPDWGAGPGRRFCHISGLRGARGLGLHRADTCEDCAQGRRLLTGACSPA